MSMRVYELAHGRTGDKGNTSNISVSCYHDGDWDYLQRELTPGVVMKAFAHIAQGAGASL
jgi:hypothetical protein